MDKLVGYGIALLLTVLIVVSLTLAYLKKGTEMEKGSPERTVQLYVSYLSDKRFTDAYDLLDQNLHAQCNLGEFTAALMWVENYFEGGTVKLKDRKIFDNISIVVIEMTSVETRIPFGLDEHSTEGTFTLSLEGNWKITEAGFNMNCPDKKSLNRSTLLPYKSLYFTEIYSHV